MTEPKLNQKFQGDSTWNMPFLQRVHSMVPVRLVNLPFSQSKQTEAPRSVGRLRRSTEALNQLRRSSEPSQAWHRRGPPTRTHARTHSKQMCVSEQQSKPQQQRQQQQTKARQGRKTNVENQPVSLTACRCGPWPCPRRTARTRGCRGSTCLQAHSEVEQHTRTRSAPVRRRQQAEEESTRQHPQREGQTGPPHSDRMLLQAMGSND